MTIISHISLEFKILQEVFAQMQNNIYRAYILKAGSNFLRETKGRLTIWSLKMVSCCLTDHPRKGNMRAQ